MSQDALEYLWAYLRLIITKCYHTFMNCHIYSNISSHWIITSLCPGILLSFQALGPPCGGVLPHKGGTSLVTSQLTVARLVIRSLQRHRFPLFIFLIFFSMAKGLSTRPIMWRGRRFKWHLRSQPAVRTQLLQHKRVERYHITWNWFSEKNS